MFLEDLLIIIDFVIVVKILLVKYGFYGVVRWFYYNLVI